MPSAATRADALRIVYSSFTRVTGFLKCVGTIPGVAPLAAGGLCGAGIAALCSLGAGKELCFRAPGSTVFGNPVRCASDGDYLLEDGQDKNKWLRVTARSAFLAATPQQGSVFLRKEDGDMVLQKDINTTTSLFLYIENVSDKKLENVRVWCPTPNTTFDLGGGDTAAPNEASSLLVGSMVPTAQVDLNMKLTVPGGTNPNAAAGIDVRAKWDSF